MPVVTIARETGAGGAEVGRLLADRLAADLVDGSLIDEVALQRLIESKADCPRPGRGMEYCRAWPLSSLS
jgi:hypothetical protein